MGHLRNWVWVLDGASGGWFQWLGIFLIRCASCNYAADDWGCLVYKDINLAFKDSNAVISVRSQQVKSMVQ
ncbi:hypothetical protein C1Y11_21365 [Pseudomonas sp. FW305-20]|nr:hypothetical protein C1Y11_21365 [Pseudomonas sp. FW305-20]PMU16216.1 hypothetical protein C1Y10_20130 [Pseudomonas sp. FW305-122]PMU36703.1 hypothetical protein C1Y12_21675 [Pseudomonas sp. FW305-47B]PMX58514.1 hypothetical protein C1Y13_20425 [Pseudomonas sp. FW305-33]PMX62291.1 hypothetical protein C1X12_24380 [Pseudomonas sp. FW305-60]